MLNRSMKSNVEQIKDLKAMAEDFPQTALDLSPYALVLTDDLLIPILKNANRYLRSLTIDHCQQLTEDIPHQIATLCPHISHLSTQSMPWKKWSTWGFFSNATFAKLQTLSIANCKNLNSFWILAPELQNHHSIAKEIMDTMYQHLIFDIEYPYTSQEFALMPPKKVSFTVNNVDTDPAQLLQLQLGYALHENQLTELILKRDLSGVPHQWLSILAKHLPRATHLSNIDLSNRNLDFKALNPVLASSNATLEVLDISHNDLHSVSETGDQLLRVLKSHPSLQKLNLNNNHLQNRDIEDISKNISEQKTLTELNLSYNPFDRLSALTKAFQGSLGLKKLYLNRSSGFLGTQIIPFIEVLKNNTILELLAISTISSNNILFHIGELLLKNITLQTLHIMQTRFTHNDKKDGWIINEVGMKEYVNYLAQNKTLTSLQLLNTLMTEDCLNILAGGLLENTTLLDFTFSIDQKSCDLKDTENYDKQLKRINCHIKQNSLTTIHSEKKLSELKILTTPLLDKKENKDSLSIDSDNLIFLDSASPDSKSLDSSYHQLQKQMFQMGSLVLSLGKKVAILSDRSDKLDHELDRDAEAQKELDIIGKNRSLYDYYHRMCQLLFYFEASKSITTLWVEQRDDMENMLVQGASMIGKSILEFIPIVSGLSCIITGLEKLHHFRHDVEKYRRAIQLSHWVEGLNCERLCHRFARKLTLLKKDYLLNPDSKVSDNHQKLWDKITTKIQDVSSYLYREWKEEHEYSIQEKVAMLDLFKVIEGIAKKAMVRPIITNVHDRTQEQISLMLEYVLNPNISLTLTSEKDARLLKSAKSVIALGLWSPTQPLIFPSSQQTTYTPPPRAPSLF